MALTDGEGMNTTMLVSPNGMGGNGFGGFGGDGWWVILLLLLVAGGFGNGFGGGNAVPFMMNTGNEVQSGFNQSALMAGIGDLNAGIFGIQNSLCNGFAGVNAGIANAAAQAEIAANGRQMASMNQNFALQTQLSNCCCENRLGIANLGADIARENCADRAALADGVRDIIESQSRGIQLILDKMCQTEIDNLKAQNISLQNQLNMANLAASQTAQTAQIEQFIAAQATA